MSYVTFMPLYACLELFGTFPLPNPDFIQGVLKWLFFSVDCAREGISNLQSPKIVEQLTAIGNFCYNYSKAPHCTITF